MYTCQTFSQTPCCSNKSGFACNEPFGELSHGNESGESGGGGGGGGGVFSTFDHLDVLLLELRVEWFGVQRT